jgi:uncharacterized protein (DUF58 family)
MIDASIHSLLEPALLARLAHLTFRTSRMTSGPLSGHHRSPLHGSSIEFAEHKEYTAGDEIRNINWRAYAKSDKYYVKKYEDETNLRCFLLVDASASMGYGPDGRTKLQVASRLAAALAFLLLKQQDSVGLVGYSDQVRCWVPPRATTGHLREIGDALVGLEARGTTNTAAAFQHLLEFVGRRSIIFVLSDFFDRTTELATQLGLFASARHQVTLLHVLDPDEIGFPFEELTLFKGMETSSEVLAEPKVIRDTYVREMKKFCDGLRQTCLERGVEYQLVDSGAPVGDAVVSYLNTRVRGPTVAV